MSDLELVTFAQYNKWANARILDTAQQVPLDQLMPIRLVSKQTAFQTLRHMVAVWWSWLKREPLEDLESVIAYWRAEDDRLINYVQSLVEADFECEVTPSWGAKAYKIKHILLRVLSHQIDHRSELGWLFTKLGFSPGELAYLDYFDSLES